MYQTTVGRGAAGGPAFFSKEIIGEMSMGDRARRAILIGLLLTTQAGLIVYAGTTPGAVREGGLLAALPAVAEYDLLAEDELAVQADVIAVDPLVAVITTPQGRERVRIRGVDRAMAAGDRIRLYGERQADETIRARSVILVASERLWYTYAVSAVALCWVAYRAVQGWRVDRAAAGLSPRRQDEGPDA